MVVTGVTDLTPAMRQYLDIKSRYPDCILLFRMGDFYEMFFEDAVVAAKVLDITLTSRNKGKEDSIPLCGFPYHALSPYLKKLIDAGFKAAICEQVEDPKLAKGVVKREVVRVVTPGLVLDTDNPKENNFLASLCFQDHHFGLAFLDISTGEFRVTESAQAEFLLMEIGGLSFREILIEQKTAENRLLQGYLKERKDCRVNIFGADYFDLPAAADRLSRYFDAAVLAHIGLERHPAMTCAAGAILRYIEETQKDHLSHINRIERYRTDEYLVLDDIAKRNLELFSTITDNRKQGSLFHCLDQTVTAPGGRRLRWWLSYPLVNPERIRERLAAVAEIRDHHLLRENLRQKLKNVYDIERLGARIAMGMANARDLNALKTSLQALPEIRDIVRELTAPLLRSLDAALDEMPDLRGRIENTIADDPPLTLREGGLIREGVDPELDRLRAATRDGKKWIAALEDRERKRTGISSLKVGFNQVFGYYIEITRANADLAPADYIRKQTLVNAERYINQELKEYEHTVLNAQEHSREREYELFVAIRTDIAKEIKRIQTTAAALADLDALAALAEAAERFNYCCPIVNDEDVIEIIDGRHPVVERMDVADGFVPNDCRLDPEQNRLLIITGPNMAGKSTYIRQCALIVLMAQMGSFVPATRARIGVTDRIFTRIGAADSLSRGQSTFMVEMNEVAHILKHATRKSLIILDEVGRGTSTFDGVSIAWAVAEHLHDAGHLGSRTLFATHYHQLTELAAAKTGAKNFNIAVKEWGDRIIFLRKIMAGGTNRSYGIQVAKIAGVPEAVIARATEILNNLEKGEMDEAGQPRIARSRKAASKGRQQLSLFADAREKMTNDIQNLDILKITPLEALNLINAWKETIDRE
ncbi:MAG: DNA mismatch repair protein MutS [Syntrophus sp. (in: bacteria)]|nr:DNA mismatch repair protein MutS [Syntrophus sp. (in: bacteria)]